MLIDPAKYKYKFADLIETYPFHAEFIEWDTKKGYGFLRATGFDGKVFAHANWIKSNNESI